MDDPMEIQEDDDEQEEKALTNGNHIPVLYASEEIQLNTCYGMK